MTPERIAEIREDLEFESNERWFLRVLIECIEDAGEGIEEVTPATTAIVMNKILGNLKAIAGIDG